MLAKLKKRKRLRVLAARRRKGRHVLAVSYPNRYKNIRGKSKHHIIAGGTARVVTYPGSNQRFRPTAD